MYKKTKTILSFFLAALIVLSISTANVVSAQQVEIYVDPAEIVDLSLTPEKTFTVNVSVSGVEEPGLYAYQFQLHYDNTLLEGVSAVLPEGHMLTPELDPGNLFKTSLKVVQEEGYVSVAITLMGEEPGKIGSGVLSTVTFNVTGTGSCALELLDTLLTDSDITEMPHEALDGYFSNKPALPPAKLSIDPSSISDPTLVPNQTFSINVTIAEVENLYGYEFKLGYNTTVLDCIEVIILTIQDETNFTPEHSIDDTAGVLWVNVTYYSPAEPITTSPPVTMANVTFQVAALGESILDLHETNIIDQSGEPIQHDIYDGYFRNLAGRDLAILDVIPSRTQAYEKFRGIEFIINITVVVKNEGDTPEAFDLRAYYDETLIGTQSVTELSPDANLTIIFQWNTTGLPLYTDYTIKAQVDEVPGEVDTENNLYVDGQVIITIFGDADKNQKVDILDVAEASKAFGSYVGHSRWNPNGDLNDDGRVSVVDMVLIAMNFGREL